VDEYFYTKWTMPNAYA